MANELDPEIYSGNNNAHTTARPMRWRLHPTSGAEEQVPISGLTDLKAYLALSDVTTDHTDAIHADLVEDMTEILATAAYEATFSGTAMRTHIDALDPVPTKVYRHWQSVSAGYHEHAEVLWRTSRPAAS